MEKIMFHFLFQKHKKITYTVLVIAVVVFLVLVIRDTLIGTSGPYYSESELAENKEILKEMEEQELPDIDGTADRESEAEEQEREQQQQQNPEQTILEEQKKIMEMADPDSAKLDQWFATSAIVGDSIVEGLQEYGFLNESILFDKIGCSVAGAKDLVTSMIRVQPEKVFLAFGMNDMDNYGEKVEVYIGHYRKMLSRIQRELPDAKIYVLAVLPMQQNAIENNPNRQYVSLYNEKLEALCQEMKVTFLNPGFILEQNAEFYEPDGIHVVKSFYYKWLTYLADMAGISK